MALHKEKKRLPVWLAVILSFLIGLVLLLSSVLAEYREFNNIVVSVLRAFGEIFLIGAVLGVLNDYFLREKMLQGMEERMEAMMRGFIDKTFRSSQKYGFQGIQDSVNFIDFFDQINPGDSVMWLDTYPPGHQTWLSTVDTKARAGCIFRFLVLKPNSSIAALRQKELGERFKKTFTLELELFLSDLEDLARRIKTETGKDSIQIKLYEDLLANPFYVIDRHHGEDVALTSFYLRKATGLDFPHLEWSGRPEGFIGLIKEYFEWKWENAEPRFPEPVKISS